MNDWDSFKFELISIGKKSFQLKEELSRNKLNSDVNATEWLLEQIYGASNIDEYPIITSIAKLHLLYLPGMHSLNADGRISHN